jgi:hypothetical protein
MRRSSGVSTNSEANMDGERLSGSGSASHAKGSRVINVHAKIVGGRVLATVNVEIGTGRFTYTVQFADQGNDAANEAEAQRKLLVLKRPSV